MREDEKDRTLKLLDQLIRARRQSRREIDRKIGYSRGQTSLILSGRIEPKLQHLLDILAALDVDSKAFFEALYADTGDMSLLGPVGRVFGNRLTALDAPALPPKPPRPRKEPELPQRVSREFAQMIERMVAAGIDARLGEMEERRRLRELEERETEEPDEP